MIGAIAGDIVGSIYEWNNRKRKDFPLFGPGCRFTDDTVLTVACADAILNDLDYGRLLVEYVHRYPDAGYGGGFIRWAFAGGGPPYNSYGNGAAMRISPVGYAFDTLDDVLARAAAFTAVTHNHPEGVKGAEATAAAVFLARTGKSKDQIREYIVSSFGYNLDPTLDDIRPGYAFDETCQGTVPQAIIAFLEATDFEDAIRNAVSLGGDSDTLACITGGIAGAFFGVPEPIQQVALAHLEGALRVTTTRFLDRYCQK